MTQTLLTLLRASSALPMFMKSEYIKVSEKDWNMKNYGGQEGRSASDENKLPFWEERKRDRESIGVHGEVSVIRAHIHLENFNMI